MYEDLVNLLSSSEGAAAHPEIFTPFEGKNPLHYSVYTQDVRNRATRSFEELLKPIEMHVVSLLKPKFSFSQGNQSSSLSIPTVSKSDYST